MWLTETNKRLRDSFFRAWEEKISIRVYLNSFFKDLKKTMAAANRYRPRVPSPNRTSSAQHDFDSDNTYR